MAASTNAEKQARAVQERADGWRSVALIVGVVMACAGAYLGAQLASACTASSFGVECELASTWPVTAGIGALGGVLPALPILGIAHVLESAAELAKAADADAVARQDGGTP